MDDRARRCPTCNGKGDTGPAYEPDTCLVCRGTGYIDKKASK